MRICVGRTAIIICTLGTWIASAGDSPPQPTRIPRIDTPIRVDGTLDDGAWRDAAHIELAYEIRPGENIEPQARTECLLVYDRTHFYAAFRAFDPEPQQIRAQLSDRDEAGDDDYVCITLDTFNDQRMGYRFCVNPLGVQMDLLLDEVGGGGGYSFNAIWASAGRITGDGYVVEMAIPFVALRFPRGGGEQTWGFEAFRRWPRSDAILMSNRQWDRDNDCVLCQFPDINGLEGISPGRNIELDPTATAVRADTRESFPDGPMVEGDADSELGLTGTWGITPSLTAAATLNPDFSQVEADAAQLDINTTFALFYSEQRPFFVEGSEVFATPLEAVYTRNIADPSWGARLTGSEGRHTLGLLVAEDEVTNLLFPGSEGSALGTLDGESTASMLRYRFDLGESSTVGALVTHRRGDGYSSTLYGADAFLRLTPSNSVTLQALRSETEYPWEIADAYHQREGRFTGNALLMNWVHTSRNWDASLTLSELDPGFRADLGFISQVGCRSADAYVGHNWWGGGNHWYSKIYLSGSSFFSEDDDGNLLSRGQSLSGFIQGPLMSMLWVGLDRHTARYQGREFDIGGWNTSLSLWPTRDLWLRLLLEQGERIDYVHARTGDSTRVLASVRYRAGRHLNLWLQHHRSGLDVTGGRLFLAEQSELNVVYQFSTRTFVRLISQYTDITRDPDLYQPEVEPRSKDLFNQLLFSYKVNPRTLVYVGYSDSHLEDHRIDLTQLNRTFFIKLAYAWLL